MVPSLEGDWCSFARQSGPQLAWFEPVGQPTQRYRYGMTIVTGRYMTPYGRLVVVPTDSLLQLPLKLVRHLNLLLGHMLVAKSANCQVHLYNLLVVIFYLLLVAGRFAWESLRLQEIGAGDETSNPVTFPQIVDERTADG